MCRSPRPSKDVTVESLAFVAHEVVQGLKGTGGATIPGIPRFGKVIAVDNSPWRRGRRRSATTADEARKDEVPVLHLTGSRDVLFCDEEAYDCSAGAEIEDNENH